VLSAGLLTGHASAQTTAPPTTQDQGRGRMGGMMADRARMRADMAAQAKKLDDLVAAMNAAKGPDRLDRIAAVVNELVAQHRAMSGRMEGMMAAPPPASPASPGRGPSGEHDGHH
jgi:hypothetical protein